MAKEVPEPGTPIYDGGDRKVVYLRTDEFDQGIGLPPRKLHIVKVVLNSGREFPETPLGTVLKNMGAYLTPIWFPKK